MSKPDEIKIIWQLLKQLTRMYEFYSKDLIHNITDTVQLTIIQRKLSDPKKKNF